MKQPEQDIKARRSLITGMGVAAAGMALGATTARAQQAGRFQPARHSLDAWMDALPGSHRVFVDSSTAHGGAEALLYGNNIYNAHQNAYEGSPGDIAMVICFRHFSTPFGYNDAMWAKYGEGFSPLMQFTDPATGKAPTTNLMNSTSQPGLPNFGNTIDIHVAKGTQFAICANATNFIASQLAAAGGADAGEIYQELVANAIPNAHFVPAGVVALTRSQEYGYSLLYAG